LVRCLTPAFSVFLSENIIIKDYGESIIYIKQDV
jgi:hypothetical protein